jgi:predicted esterase
VVIIKNLLVYLHGFGSVDSENIEFQQKLAEKLNAHLISPLAKLSSSRGCGRISGGFAWYPIGKKDIDYVNYFWFPLHQVAITDEISYTLKKTNLGWENVILSGRGQGAFTAIKLGISIKIPNVKAIISFNGFYNPKGDFPINEGKINTPILWANGAKDKVSDEKKKDSYKLLKKKHFNPKIIKMPNTNYDELSLKDINRVVRELKEMGVSR